MELSSEEFDLCGDAFNTHVLQNGFGRIDSLWKLRNVLQALGQCPTDEEMQNLLPEADSVIEFDEFIRTIEKEKSRFFLPMPPDSDTVEAFVAMGGNTTKEGEVSTALLSSMVKNFDLSLDIDKLVEEVDTDGSGTITYEEFAHMFAPPHHDDSGNRSTASRHHHHHHHYPRRISQGHDGKHAVPHSRDGHRAMSSRGRVSLRGASFIGALKRGTTPLGSVGPNGGGAAAGPVSDPQGAGLDDDQSEESGSAPSLEVRGAKTALPLMSISAIGGNRVTTVIASGAKKTSESRRRTRDELLHLKLHRLERNMKRTGMVGGELSAITMPLSLPSSTKRQARRYSTFKKTEAEARTAAASLRGRVFPAKRRNQHGGGGTAVDFSIRLMYLHAGSSASSAGCGGALLRSNRLLSPLLLKGCPSPVVAQTAVGVKPSLKAAAQQGRLGGEKHSLSPGGSSSRACFGVSLVREQLEGKLGMMSSAPSPMCSWLAERLAINQEHTSSSILQHTELDDSVALEERLPPEPFAPGHQAEALKAVYSTEQVKCLTSSGTFKG